MTHFGSDSFRAEVWRFVKSEWKKLGGTKQAQPPKHGYKLRNDKTGWPVIFVELKGGSGSVGKHPERFKRFYILRRYNVEKFKSEIAKIANGLGAKGTAGKLSVRRQIKNGRPAGLNCDVSDWRSWKAIIKVVLTWAWRRQDKK